VAKHRGVPKSTSDIRQAVIRRRKTKGRNFFRDFVINKKRLKVGWNLKKKHYTFGGTAKIHVSIEYSSPFPIDDSAIKNNRFRLSWRRDYGENERAIYEAQYAKTIRRTLGKLTYEEAKKLFEKEMMSEDKKFVQMSSQFSSDNKESGKIEKLKWFKLIVR
jgi:hypothetical protein